MKIIDLMDEATQKAVYEELKAKFSTGPTPEEIDKAAEAYAAEAAKLRNTRGAINNPAPGLLDNLK
jgi:hypothetical protein